MVTFQRYSVVEESSVRGIINPETFRPALLTRDDAMLEMLNSPLILVVEDDPESRFTIRFALEGEGYRVTAVSNGQHALREMSRAAPDLILSAVGSIEVGAEAFFQAVRAHPKWSTIPFIFLTSLDAREFSRRSRELGAEDVLFKPVNRSDLVSIVRSRLARNQQLMLAEMRVSYELSLMMLANAVEVRDQHTRGHIERVMDYSLLIARQMCLSSVETHVIRFGSILHDIGKIYIQETILKKPGPLNELESQEMKRHPEVGEVLLRNIGYLASALPVIRHHHERWDGLGYPDRLRGENIPLPARVVAVADALDAITAGRIYRPARTFPEALEDIVLKSGTAYDPQVVLALNQAWTDVIRIGASLTH
jgi:putative two-component system response regulator